MAKTDKEVSHISHFFFFTSLLFHGTWKSKIFIYAQIRDRVYRPVLDKMELKYDSYQQNDKKFPL